MSLGSLRSGFLLTLGLLQKEKLKFLISTLVLSGTASDEGPGVQVGAAWVVPLDRTYVSVA